ncbi:N-acetylmuramoyl-L-alanine amidase CwlD [Oceanobacillus alkalisoli]|uniref:N-acetylmuramoyl-L-alanine amidase CwlD n=1 Tax=Oceanobacillus alkalisoli TaxID=2925113 RepID=UPI001EEF7B9D|nr:N-acetylmuramoyl-L-alanine amidase CwlD [Oceanobacillus alkalisoli]MCF3943959.1 N-acetylmuramoyl-L-alanine amidase CwlD [Oceanobacillus alkalisoli]MCG5104538.1 N-acetylmuramoyl-L-alanine amidase CwlD [Oceanobacillus alkalisoli]
MERLFKMGTWAFGLILLVYLIQMPIKETDTTWASWSLPLSGKVIVLDPGHGGSDGGAVGRDDTVEKDIALKVTKQLQRYLQQAGALVYLTRETDEDLADEDTQGLSRRKSEDIRNRLQFIEHKQADLFLTIHLNALPSERWRGAQAFYYPSFDENEHLARMVQEEIRSNLENTDREALEIDGIYLLKHAEAPGALVEIGFLSNEEERELLKQDDYQEQMAASIYRGVLRYITEPAEEKE